MTAQEHEILQQKMKGLAQETILKWLAGMLRIQLALSPESGRAAFLEGMAAKLRSGAEEYSDLTIPWLDAASSDMQAAMFQESYDEVSKLVFDIAASRLTPAEEAQIRAATDRPR